MYEEYQMSHLAFKPFKVRCLTQKSRKIHIQAVRYLNHPISKDENIYSNACVNLCKSTKIVVAYILYTVKAITLNHLKV